MVDDLVGLDKKTRAAKAVKSSVNPQKRTGEKAVALGGYEPR